MVTLEKQVREANTALAVKSARVKELEAQVPALQREVETNRTALDASRRELTTARAAAQELEKKNSALIKQATMSLSRESELKQSLNVSKAQTSRLDRDLAQAKSALSSAVQQAQDASKWVLARHHGMAWEGGRGGDACTAREEARHECTQQQVLHAGTTLCLIFFKACS